MRRAASLTPGGVGGRVEAGFELGPVKVRAQRARPPGEVEEPDEWAPDLERNLRVRAPGPRVRLDPAQIGDPGLSRLDVFVATLQGLCLALPAFVLLRAYLWRPIEALLAEVVLLDAGRAQLRLTLLGCVLSTSLLTTIVAASRSAPRRRIGRLTRWGAFLGGVWLSFWSLAALVAVLG